MDTWVWIVIAIVVIATIALVAWMAGSKRRTATLQEQFGPEYERTMRMSESSARCGERAVGPPRTPGRAGHPAVERVGARSIRGCVARRAGRVRR